MRQKAFQWMLATLVALLSMGNTVHAAKKVFTLGDSTMANYDESVTNTRGWGMYFGNFLTDGWTSVNFARGGRDSRGGFNELWQEAKNSVTEGDYVLIQFAHNDEKYNGMDNEQLQAYYTAKGDATNAAAVKKDGRGTVPSTTYKEWLTKIVDAVKEKGATPVLVSAVCRCYFGSDNKITKTGQHNLADKYDAIVNGTIKTGQKLTTDDHSMDYTYQMKQLAEELNVAFIDMTAATKKFYEDYGTYAKCYAALFDKGAETDNTHYNTTGALSAARLCAQLMKEKGLLADHIVVPTDMAFNPAKADLGEVYVGQSTTKELTLSALGLSPATGTVTISASEGIQLSTDKQNWKSTLAVDYQNGTLIKAIYAKVSITATGTFSGTITAAQDTKTTVADITVSGIELGGGTPFTATWTLTASDDAVVDGNAVAAAAKVEGMEKYANNSTQGLMVSTSDGGAWVKAEDDSPNQYVQFTVTAPDGQKLDINRIAMKVGGRGGNGMMCHVYYSTDGFATRTTIYAPPSMASGVLNEVEATPVIKLEEGDQLQVRVYPWYTSNATGKWLCIKDVVIGGQSKDAAGVNIQGSITYKMDQGGVAQGDDAIMDPMELGAGFAAKQWKAGNMLTVEGTKSYRGAEGEANIPQTRIYNGTGASLSSTPEEDNTLTLTLTPEEGFTFVPSRLSFQAARYGTDGGTITASIAAGQTAMDIVSNGSVNRDGKSLTIQSYSEEVSGITAKADQPLKVNFSFLGLGKTKEMGLSNVVVEGTLVGAATQVTKYVLTTMVEPAEAGAISREPELEAYKEGSQVVLKATKNFGYKFKEWQDGNGNTVSTEETTTVTMDSEKTMKAVFVAVPVYKVSTSVTNDADRSLGSITLTPNDHDNQYEEGTKISATANESKILKFLSWTDDGDNASAGATRELTVTKDMTITANYEVQDFIAVFDASTTESYAYTNTAGYPFSADVVWDSERQAKVSVVKTADGSLAYSQDGGIPVVRNRKDVVLQTISGIYQNGYRSSDVAFQYQFSTKGFTSVRFVGDMAAKNMANRQWKALVSTDGKEWTQLGDSWEVTANVQTPIEFSMPDNQELVYVRITGEGKETLSDQYPFDKKFDGLDYTTKSENGVGNVFILGEAETTTDDEAPIVTATVPSGSAAGVSASGKITISFDERIEANDQADAATLTAASGTPVTIAPEWSNRSVSFSYSQLKYSTQYTFTMPAGYVQDKSGNLLAQPVTITFTTMDRPTVAKGLYDAVVTTTDELVEAIKAANNREDKATRYRIFVKKGVYKLPTGANKHYTHTNNDGTITYWEGDLPDPITYIKAANISFIGEDRQATIITQDISNDADMLFDGQFGKAHKYEEINNSAVLQLEGSATGTFFQDITIKSGINDALGRNLAVHDKSTKTIYKNTLLYGYQDTWTSNNQQGLFYFEGGQVRGRTDYLCGKGDAYFQGLELLQVAGGYAAVPSTPKAIGWVFNGCTFSADGSGVDGSYTLGRPWGKGTPVAVFINTKMNVSPKAEGWNEMSNGWPQRFAEYNSVSSMGVALDLSSRKRIFGGSHENNPVLTAEEAAQYSDLHSMFGDWDPTLATEQAPMVTNVTLEGNTLKWKGSDYALLYAICLDGNVVAFTTDEELDLSTLDTPAGARGGVAAAARYTVRAANEMGGLNEQSDTASVVNAINEIAPTAGTAHRQVYSLAGLLVNGNPMSYKLPKGVYIVSGKKVVVK